MKRLPFRRPEIGRSIAAFIAGALLVSSSAPAAASTAANWTFLGNNAHTSYSADPLITAASAASMGVKWMANLYSTDLGSPVIAYNATLGKNVVYVGNERGDVYALDAATGQVIWSTNVGYNDKVRATPAVAPDGSVWVATNFDATLYKLNGATGSVMCSAKSPDGLAIMGSAMVTTPAGGPATVYWGSIDGTPVNVNGPLVGTNESDCSQRFAFSSYRSGHAGPWVTPAYAVTKAGKPVVVFGTADTDSTEYSLDANTGALNWQFHTYNPADYDVGDGATISVPGNNGSADGMVYVNNKYGIEYALDLSTGSVAWQYNIYPANWTALRNTISSAALDGNNLVFGFANGVDALNATTGALKWNYAAAAEVGSSPAIVGPTGKEVVAFGDYTGAFRLLSLASGTALYAYQTGGYITSSPAEANGVMYIASSDGFLYAFAQNGGTGSAPASSISAPANNAVVANPNGSLTVSGTSTDAAGVSSVEIAVQQGGAAGKWYNAATGAFAAAPMRNEATLASPGAKSTAWTFTLPVPAGGSNYEVFANAVNVSHIDEKGQTSSFSVSPSTNAPVVHTSVFDAAPGSTFTATGNAFRPGETVTFSLFGVTVASATVAASGNVPQTQMSVPDDAAFGPTSLIATGSTSGKTSSATIYVTNEWTQAGYGATRGGNEPNDAVIAHTIDVGKNTILGRSWTYPSGAPINTSPAVVNGVAYFGNDAGILSAVNAQSGSPVWKFQIPSNAAIHGSPAVDATGNVFIGADDGNLYEVSAKGASIRTVAVGGHVLAPAFANDQIVVASDAGIVSAISDATGSTRWSVNAGSAIHSLPAYDAKAGLVLVGTDAGTVRAYSSATGAQKWSASAGGAIAGPITVYNGSVYAGAGDGKLYAYREQAGTLEWSFVADGPVTSGVVVGGATNLTFGTSKGTIFQVTPAGAKMFTQAGRYGNSAIVGIASVNQNAFGTTAGGLIGATREQGTSSLNPWSFQTNGTMSAAPAILNGTVYVGSADGNLYAFTPNGATPTSVTKSGGAIVKITSDWSCITQP